MPGRPRYFKLRLFLKGKIKTFRYKMKLPDDGQLDISNWSNAIQTDSVLASFNSLCLQKIFNRLPKTDAIFLSSTCRQLYSVWKENQGRKKAATFTNFHPSEDPDKEKSLKVFFLSNIDPLADDDNVKEWFANGKVNFQTPRAKTKAWPACLKRRKLLRVYRWKTKENKNRSKNCFRYAQRKAARKWLATQLPSRQTRPTLYDSTLKFVEMFPNLRYLEVTVILPNKGKFAPLLLGLTSKLSLLVTLRISADFGKAGATAAESPDYYLRPLSKLIHPKLKHLTVTFPNGSVWESIDSKYELPQLPILKQLTSFSFFANLEVSSLFRLIQELFITSPFAAHLKPGKGARFGMKMSGKDYPILLKNMSEFNIIWLTEPAVLLYFTYLEFTLFNNAEQETNFLPWLSRMSHLQKVEVDFCDARCNQYLYLLAALSPLEHLQELTLECHYNILKSWHLYEKAEMENRSEMMHNNGVKINDDPTPALPSLPLVRSLTLNVPFKHSRLNVASLLHLGHCFPQLQHFRCNFSIDSNLFGPVDRRIGSFINITLPRLQTMGRRLTDELMNQLSNVPQMEVHFHFFSEVGYVYFSSLESLLAGRVCRRRPHKNDFWQDYTELNFIEELDSSEEERPLGRLLDTQRYTRKDRFMKYRPQFARKRNRQHPVFGRPL